MDVTDTLIPSAPQWFLIKFAGPVAVGHPFGILLTGVSMPMFLRWLLDDFRSDNNWTRSIVFIAMICEIIYCSSLFVNVWDLMIPQDRSVENLVDGCDHLCLYVTASENTVLPIIIMAVQSWLARRVFIFIRSRPVKAAFLVITVACLLCELLAWTLGIASVSLAYTNPNLVGVSGASAELINAGREFFLYIASAFLDVLISVVLARECYSHIRGFNKQTDKMLKRMMRIALITASYTTVIAIMVAATAFGPVPSTMTFMHWTLSRSIPALYTITLFTMLATRKQAHSRTHATSSEGINGSSSGGGATTFSSVPPVSYQRRVVHYGDERHQPQNFIGLEKIKADDSPFSVAQNDSHDGSVKTENEV